MSFDLLIQRADELVARARAALQQGGPTGRHSFFVFESVTDDPVECAFKISTGGVGLMEQAFHKAVEDGSPAVLVISDMWVAKQNQVEDGKSLAEVVGRRSALVAFLHLPDGTSHVREQIYADENGTRYFIDRGWKQSNGVLRGLFANPWLGTHTDTHISS